MSATPPASPGSPDSPALRVRGVHKRFGRTQALAGVDLELRAGEVHALLGENGAGKSTLMKVLAGVQRADAGTLELAGAPYAPAGPGDARAAGVAVVYQELSLAPHLTVEENLTLGREVTCCGFVRGSAWRGRVAEVLARLEHPAVVPQARVSSLPPAARQLVEIARALLVDARVLILDEPTSSLGVEDVQHLFDVVRRLKGEGVAIVYVSHFLEEVFALADRYTVLRDGATVATGRVADVDEDELVEAMIGRKLEQMFPRVEHAVGEPVLDLAGLSGRGAPSDVDLTLHRGEIVGLAGLVGAGRTELLRALFGLAPITAGHVRRLAAGGTVDLTRGGVPARLAAGVGFLSEDRAGEGLALERSVEDNLCLGRLAPFARWGWLDLGALRRTARGWLERLDVRCDRPDQPIRDLSGGNQQKVALARLLHHDVDVLLLDEPTRGIDVGSKAELYRRIGELAAAGKAVLVASSSTPELLGICDRVGVMRRGRLVAVRPASEWTEADVLRHAVGVEERVA